MANLKSDGKVFDANLIIVTGTTLTAGTLIWADISGTNVVRAVRSFSGVTPESAATPTGLGVASLDGGGPQGITGVFLGVLANTQTGVGNLSGGHQTGVAFYTEGVFDFNTTPTSSAPIRIGYPVWATNADTVVCLLSGISTVTGSSTNTTGNAPIGVCSFIPGAGVVNSNSVARTVRVKLFAFRTIGSLQT